MRLAPLLPLAAWLAPRASTLGFTGFPHPEQFLHNMMEPALALSALLGANPDRSICEIGPGSGGLGLALAFLHPDAHVTLADRRQRVVSFLDVAAHALGLSNVDAVRCDLRPTDSGPVWDIVCLRALTSPRTALEIAAAHAREYICAWHSSTCHDYGQPIAGFSLAGRAAIPAANIVATLYSRA